MIWCRQKKNDLERDKKRGGIGENFYSGEICRSKCIYIVQSKKTNEWVKIEYIYIYIYVQSITVYFFPQIKKLNYMFNQKHVQLGILW